MRIHSPTKGIVDTDTHESLRIGDGGYTVPWLHLRQLNVPTNYDLAGLSPGDFKQAMTNSADEASGAVSNALSAASLVGSGGMEVTSMADSVSSVSLQPRAD